MAYLNLTGLERLLYNIKSLFVDKDTYNSFSEYQVVPPEGIQLGPGASVLYYLFDGNGLQIQREVFLTPINTNYTVTLVVGSHQYNNYIDQQINNYYVQGNQTIRDYTVVILWKKERFYNWET